MNILYKSNIEYADYAINHVKWCVHGCKYCYAYNILDRFQPSDETGTIEEMRSKRIVEIKRDVIIRLEKDLKTRKGREVEKVYLSFMTDPFPCSLYLDSTKEKTLVYDINLLSVQIIELLQKYDKQVITLTKGLFPEDVQFFNKDKVMFGITITSLDESYKQKYEPFTSNPDHRINQLKELSKLGFKTWVSLEPYPTSNIVEQELTDILKEIKFVNRIVFGRWNYDKRINDYLKKDSSFYSRKVGYLKTWCRNLGIELIIKKGTIQEKCFLVS